VLAGRRVGHRQLAGDGRRLERALSAAPRALAEPAWRALEAAHEQRLARWLEPHAQRRRRGEEHPVLDFLFTYYSQPPGRLRRWHPGVGRAVAGPSAAAHLDRPFTAQVDAEDDDGRAVRAVGLDLPAFLERRGEAVARTADLLRATAGRPAQLGCFGLHEWAMVYRPEPGEVRHGAPLRLGAAGTAAVVEGARLRCSHADAYRFFSRGARPRNELVPTRATQRDLEQPGCVHATMDLYKWSYKLAPAVPGELVADCFALAVEARELDMRAAPYDLTAWGYEPVRIETPEGRAAYVAEQRRLAERGAALRGRLLAVCDRLLGFRTVGA
jgi:hypothetical protein